MALSYDEILRQREEALRRGTPVSPEAAPPAGLGNRGVNISSAGLTVQNAVATSGGGALFTRDTSKIINESDRARAQAAQGMITPETQQRNIEGTAARAAAISKFEEERSVAEPPAKPSEFVNYAGLSATEAKNYNMAYIAAATGLGTGVVTEETYKNYFSKTPAPYAYKEAETGSPYYNLYLSLDEGVSKNVVSLIPASINAIGKPTVAAQGVPVKAGDIYYQLQGKEEMKKSETPYTVNVVLGKTFGTAGSSSLSAGGLPSDVNQPTTPQTQAPFQFGIVGGSIGIGGLPVGHPDAPTVPQYVTIQKEVDTSQYKYNLYPAGTFERETEKRVESAAVGIETSPVHWLTEQGKGVNEWVMGLPQANLGGSNFGRKVVGGTIEATLGMPEGIAKSAVAGVGVGQIYLKESIYDPLAGKREWRPLAAEPTTSVYGITTKRYIGAMTDTGDYYAAVHPASPTFQPVQLGVLMAGAAIPFVAIKGVKLVSENIVVPRLTERLGQRIEVTSTGEVTVQAKTEVQPISTTRIVGSGENFRLASTDQLGGTAILARGEQLAVVKATPILKIFGREVPIGLSREVGTFAIEQKSMGIEGFAYRIEPTGSAGIENVISTSGNMKMAGGFEMESMVRPSVEAQLVPSKQGSVLNLGKDNIDLSQASKVKYSPSVSGEPTGLAGEYYQRPTLNMENVKLTVKYPNIDVSTSGSVVSPDFLSTGMTRQSIVQSLSRSAAGKISGTEATFTSLVQQTGSSLFTYEIGKTPIGKNVVSVKGNLVIKDAAGVMGETTKALPSRADVFPSSGAQAGIVEVGGRAVPRTRGGTPLKFDLGKNVVGEAATSPTKKGAAQVSVQTQSSIDLKTLAKSVATEQLSVSKNVPEATIELPQLKGFGVAKIPTQSRVSGGINSFERETTTSGVFKTSSITGSLGGITLKVGEFYTPKQPAIERQPSSLKVNEMSKLSEVSRTSQTTRITEVTKTQQLTKMGNPNNPNPTTIPTPPPPPPFVPTGFPMGGLGGVAEWSAQKGKKPKGQYNPSLTAVMFNIRGGKGKSEQFGFALRPIPTKEKKEKASKMAISSSMVKKAGFTIEKKK